jgi:pyocin large subunit-like protein
VPNTSGFLNARQLNLHYVLHGAEFGATNANEYEQMADGFWAVPKPAHVHECVRKSGDVVRFDAHTQAYGVVNAKGAIRTFFKPVPCVSLPAPQRAAAKLSGRCHGHASNLIYFQVECKRW